jgi:hypothetical protein
MLLGAPRLSGLEMRPTFMPDGANLTAESFISLLAKPYLRDDRAKVETYKISFMTETEVVCSCTNNDILKGLRTNEVIVKGDKKGAHTCKQNIYLSRLGVTADEHVRT